MTQHHGWLIVLRPTRIDMLTEGPTEREAAALRAHFEHVRGHCTAGRLLLAGRTQTSDASTMGIAILATMAESEARAIMDADPAVEAGVMRAELSPFRVALKAETGW